MFSHSHIILQTKFKKQKRSHIITSLNSHKKILVTLSFSNLAAQYLSLFFLSNRDKKNTPRFHTKKHQKNPNITQMIKYC